MKKLIFFLALAAFGQQTGYKFNPFTGNLDLAGNGFTAPSGYSTAVTSGVTLTVTAATHGQGTTPVAFCFDNGTPATAVACSYTVSSTGEVVLTTPVFTGTVIIRGPGATAGAAGNVVGPASSTNGAIAFNSGTGGKTLASSSTFVWDPSNNRLGVGTGAPAEKIHSDGAIVVSGVRSGTSTTSGLYLSFNTNIGFVTSTTPGTAGRQLQLEGTPLTFHNSNSGSEMARFAVTTNNFLVGGGTTDGGFRADINTSGSSGTFRVYDATATTGTTKAVFRAGAGQSGNVISVQSSGGTEVLNVAASGAITSVSNFTVVPGQFFQWVSASRIGSPSDSVITLSNQASNDFNRLQFGGTTSSFPSLKRSSAGLQVRLADDSAFTSIQASSYISNDGSAGITGATCSSFKNGLCVAP